MPPDLAPARVGDASGGIKRDAAAFGIPVFGSKCGGQARAMVQAGWRAAGAGPGEDAVGLQDLRGMKEQVRGGDESVGFASGNPTCGVVCWRSSHVFTARPRFLCRGPLLCFSRSRGNKAPRSPSERVWLQFECARGWRASSIGDDRGGRQPDDAVESLQDVPKGRAAGTAAISESHLHPGSHPEGHRHLRFRHPRPCDL